MRFAKHALFAAGLAATMGTGLVVAQDRMARPPEAEATIYRDLGYNGPAVAISSSNPNMGLAWPVNAIRVRSGVWQLCEQTNYRGRCRIYNTDTPMLGSIRRGVAVQSIRLIDGSGGGGWQPGQEMANDQVTRGNFAEFHTQPAENGYRVLSCARGSATAACAARTADDYCRSIGWNGSAREHQETVNGRVYLADVLCVRSGY